jgi:DNA-binding LacI/PurR family transcriptional regulator
VPKDVSIGGCGNFDVASMVTPRLTTVRWPTAELGEYAARYLLNKLENKPVPTQQVFPVELLIRESTAIPPKKGHGH